MVHRVKGDEVTIGVIQLHHALYWNEGSGCSTLQSAHSSIGTGATHCSGDSETVPEALSNFQGIKEIMDGGWGIGLPTEPRLSTSSGDGQLFRRPCPLSVRVYIDRGRASCSEGAAHVVPALTRLFTSTHVGQVSQAKARSDRGCPPCFPPWTDTGEHTIITINLRRLNKDLVSLKAAGRVSRSSYRPDV